MRIDFLTLFVGSFVAFSYTAEAQPLRTVEKVVESGKIQQIERLVGLDADCHPIAKPTISLLQEPSQGRVTVENISVYPSFPPQNPRYRCNTKKVIGQGIFYKSRPSSSGEDAFIVEFVDLLGTPHRLRYHVTIRSNGKPETADQKSL